MNAKAFSSVTARLGLFVLLNNAESFTWDALSPVLRLVSVLFVLLFLFCLCLLVPLVSSLFSFVFCFPVSVVRPVCSSLSVWLCLWFSLYLSIYLSIPCFSGFSLCSFFSCSCLFPLAVNQRDRGQETWSGFGAISSCKWSREQSCSCRTVNRSGNEIVGRRRGPVLVPFLPVASVSWGRWWTVETAVVLLKWLSSIYPLNFLYLTIGSLISLIKQFQVQLSPQTSNSSNFWPN
jgi:hypothetical protein